MTLRLSCKRWLMKLEKHRKVHSKLTSAKPPAVAEPVFLSETYKLCMAEEQRPKKLSGRTGRTNRLSRSERYRRAAALLREWMADESGYDEIVGLLLDEELKKDPIRFREEF
jgi:hypothetical protein